jgi:hypothetical protein
LLQPPAGPHWTQTSFDAKPASQLSEASFDPQSVTTKHANNTKVHRSDMGRRPPLNVSLTMARTARRWREDNSSRLVVNVAPMEFAASLIAQRGDLRTFAEVLVG